MLGYFACERRLAAVTFRGVAALLLAAGLTACGGGGGGSPLDGSSAGGADTRSTPQAGGVGAGPGLEGLFTDRLDADEKLTAVTVCAGWLVDAIQLFTNKPGKQYAKHGGPGGACQTLTLQAGESITRTFGSAGAVINSIGFETSTGRIFGPFGTAGASGGAPYSMSTAGSFRGFSGSDGSYAGVTVLAQLNLIGDQTGGAGGAAFIDRMQPDERVVEVKICYRTDSYVGSVQLRTNLGWRPKRGADAMGTPTCQSTLLDDGEYIAEIFGRASQYVDALGFLTSTGRRVGPFGGPGGVDFSQTVLERGRFAGWYGAAGGWLDRIGLMAHPAGSPDMGSMFADQLPLGEVIRQVKVCTFFSTTYQTTVVRSVQAITNVKPMALNGGPTTGGVGCTTVSMADGEFITEMFGGAGSAIDSVGFRMNTGREVAPIGGPGGKPYLLRNPSTTSFLGFSGRYSYDVEVNALDFAAPDLFPPMPAPTATAATNGWWSDVAAWPIIGIHASVLGDGRVLTYGSDGTGIQGAFVYDIWNPALGTGVNSHNTLSVTTGTDIFCSAQTLLSNGTVLLAGGDNRAQGGYNKGVRDVNVFNPSTQTMTAVSKLSLARWYATQTMLPSGRILVTGGLDENGFFIPIPELYTPGVGWTMVMGAANAALSISYPRVFVAPRPTASSTDEVYVIGTGGNGIYRITVTAAGAGTFTDTGVRLPGNHDWQRPSLQYAPGKVLVNVGKTRPDQSWDGGANVILTLPASSATRPTVVETGSLSQQRLWSNYVQLPTGEVLAVGGAQNDTGAALVGLVAQHVEIWNPATSAWRRGASELRPRLYHSAGVLLADGRVLSTGGGAPGPVNNLNAQIYSPPYLYQAGGNGALAARPTITSAPGIVSIGGLTITIQTPQASSVKKVTLTRMGSVTHSYDFDSRHMALSITSVTTGTVNVRSPTSRFMAPPGRYLLTLVNGAGVPSVSWPVRID